MHNKEEACFKVVVLGIYGPSTHRSGLSYLLGKASKAFYQYLMHIILSLNDNCLLASAEGWECSLNIFMWLDRGMIEPATPNLRTNPLLTTLEMKNKHNGFQPIRVCERRTKALR